MSRSVRLSVCSYLSVGRSVCLSVGLCFGRSVVLSVGRSVSQYFPMPWMENSIQPYSSSYICSERLPALLDQKVKTRRNEVIGSGARAKSANCQWGGKSEDELDVYYDPEMLFRSCPFLLNLFRCGTSLLRYLFVLRRTDLIESG